jgi:hypothetical protein
MPDLGQIWEFAMELAVTFRGPTLPGAPDEIYENLLTMSQAGEAEYNKRRFPGQKGNSKGIASA